MPITVTDDVVNKYIDISQNEVIDPDMTSIRIIDSR